MPHMTIIIFDEIYVRFFDPIYNPKMVLLNKYDYFSAKMNMVYMIL